jgi:hypothetical protein
MGFLGGAFINFKLKVVEILNFESMLSLEIHLIFNFFLQLSFIVIIMFTLGINSHIHTWANGICHISLFIR